MKVDTRSVPAAGLVLQGQVDSADIDIVDSTLDWKSPIACRLRLQVTGNILLVRGSLSCRIDYICSRCLKTFPSLLEIGDFRAEVEFTPPFAIIDLTANIRQDIILGLKYKPVCSENCRGLCLQCGQDLNLGSCGCSKSPSAASPFSRLANLKLD